MVLTRIVDGQEYSDFIICKPSGYFMCATGYDAYIISEVLEYKLIQDKDGICKVGFPHGSIDKVTEVLSAQGINHIFVKAGKIIIKKEFDDNRYHKFARGYETIEKGEYVYPETKKDKGEDRPQIIDSVGINSTVTLRDCLTNEVFTYNILPSYKEYEIKGYGGSYYGAKYEEKIRSKANPIDDNTISENAPLAKVLSGHKAGDTVKLINEGVVDIYYIEEVINSGTIYKAEITDGIRKDLTENQNSLDNSSGLQNEEMIKEIQKFLSEEDESLDNAIKNINNLIEFMLKLEINEDISKHMKALIDLKLYLTN